MLPASAWSGRGVLAFLAGVTAVLFFVGGVAGGLVADDYPRGGRLAGLGLAAYGAVGLLLVYRVVRARPGSRSSSD